MKKKHNSTLNFAPCFMLFDLSLKMINCIKTRNLFDHRGSTMTPLPGVQIYLQPCVTLTSSLPKLTLSCPCPVDHLCQLASKLVHCF